MSGRWRSTNAHYRIPANVDGEEPCQRTHPIENPIFAVTIVLPGVRVYAAKKGPPDASGNAVINADLVFNDNLAPGVSRHERDS
jgi:hypothetical protein